MNAHQGVPVAALSNNPVTFLPPTSFSLYIWGESSSGKPAAFCCPPLPTAAHKTCQVTIGWGFLSTLAQPCSYLKHLLGFFFSLSLFFIAMHFLLRNLWPLVQLVSAEEGSGAWSEALTVWQDGGVSAGPGCSRALWGASGLLSGSGQSWLSRLTSLEPTSETNTLSQPASLSLRRKCDSFSVWLCCVLVHWGSRSEVSSLTLGVFF